MMKDEQVKRYGQW